ncbi:MAG: SGNH/GDSL hydrolase family protein [Acutalibacteraceae bacterium]|nr:SGNH/GDSL hydrolase family protein [Acutalibacteraceae bacterium]
MKNNAIIFGDSYSTYAGYIPEGYAVYYPNLDVLSANDTWWKMVADKTGLNIVQNNSWSGSTVCYTGYSNTDCSETSSFICRFENLKKEGFFRENEIDTVFVFGTTNDSWAGSPLGEVKFDNFEKQDLYCVLPAISYFLKSIRETLPNAQVYCLVNTEIKTVIIDAFKVVCEKYKIKNIAFEYIEKKEGHPTAAGMKQIADEVIKKMK